MSGDTAGTSPPSSAFPAGPGFVWFKRVVYTLLVVDVGLLYTFGNWREVVEQTGWLLILGSFELESRGLARLDDGRKARPVLLTELAGYALALFSWGAYAFESEWLNFANASLWLLIAAALAYDLHVPGHYGSLGWRLRNMAKGALYLGVAGVALSWGLAGEWLDFWDAMVWLTCFFFIELKVFDSEARQRIPAA